MASQPLPEFVHLEPSQLGTKEYWDKLYATEISNHDADPSDVGTIWFEDSSAEDKILSFLRSPLLKLNPSRTSFLDIGTGNGHLLFRLREGEDDSRGNEDDEESNPERTAAGSLETSKTKKFSGRILGTDYSSKSIELAQRIAHEKKPFPPIEFLHFDIMTSCSETSISPLNADGWDVVLDKGTFDAISLSGELDSLGRKLCEGYKDQIVPLMRPGGLFLVTSCNWTEEELRDWFEGDELVFEAAIAYRSFRFGGKKGQNVSSVCFRRKGVHDGP